MSSSDSNAAKRIYEARSSAGLTRKELGSIIGVTEKTIKNWEDGVSEPNFSLGCELLTVCNNILNETMLAMQYNEFSDKGYEMTDNQCRQAVISYFRSVASDRECRLALFGHVGRHGIASEAESEMRCQFDHLPTADKYFIGQAMKNIYLIRYSQGALSRQSENVLPDLDKIDEAMDLWKSEILGDAGKSENTGYDYEPVEPEIYKL